MERRTRLIYIIAWSVAIIAAGSAAVYRFVIADSSQVAHVPVPVVGVPGSAHIHASLLIMNENAPINFCEKKYMLASKVAHFEDDDCILVHAHATGVTLDTFLRSIEVNLTEDCLHTSDNIQLCNDTKNMLRVVINGQEVSVSTLANYVLKNNDHILVNYGPETGANLRFKYNQVPNIPLDVNEPLK